MAIFRFFFKMGAGCHLGFCYISKMTSRCQYLKRRPSYCDFPFFKMAAAAILDFVGFYFQTTHEVYLTTKAMFKILCRYDLYFRRYCDFHFQKFGLKCLFGPKNWCFG